MNKLFDLLLLIQILSIICLASECVFIMTKWRTRLHGILLFSVLVTLVNNVGYLLEMLAKTEEGYLMALKMSYLGRVWIPYALLILTLNLCGVQYKKWLSHSLCCIHIFTFVLVMSLEVNSWYYSSMTFVTEGVFSHMVFGHGPWYFFYQNFVVTGYVLFGVSLLIINICKKQELQIKKRLITITASILVESFFFLIGVLKIFGAYDVTMVGYAIAAVIMGVGLYRYDILGTLEMAKDFCLEEIPEGVVVIDALGKLEYANARAQEALGFGCDCDYIEVDISDKITLLEDRVQNNESLTLGTKTYSVEKKDLIHDDCLKGTIYVLEDDTEIYHYMDALKEQKDIAESARIDAENASKSKSDFVSFVSHEIRTPMNAVVGMTDLLLRESDDLNEKQKKYLLNIKNSGAALVMIVNDILDQSKIEAGKMEIIDSVYEIRPLTDDIKMIIENRLEGKPIDLYMEVDEEVPKSLVGDSLRIRQILINLMNNAVKFTERGFIKVSIKKEFEETDKISLKFSVEDSGQGIKSEDLEKLGQAFTQVDTAKNYTKEGTGLGLTISKNFISMMGGRLEVESIYGKGTTFFFSITQGVVNEGIVGEEVNTGDSLEDFTCSSSRFLVVDDNSINLMIAEELMEPLLCQVDTVDSALKAIDLIKANTYDLIFMDYLMPEMDGIEATSKIRAIGNAEEADEYFKKVPIIALTGDGSDETRDSFLIAGVNDFLEKPIDMKSIRKIVYKYLPKEKIENAK